MHQTRNEVIRALPLPRKGTKYVAFALRNNSSAVSVVVALRDMLKLASTSKEVNHMIHNKMIKLNGKIVTDSHQPIDLFSIFHADKIYKLVLLPTGRFSFEETKDTSRPLRVIGKTAVKNKKIQYNLHDGTNINSNDKINVGDTLVIDFENKVKKHISLEKGKGVIITSGSNIGKVGKIKEVSGKKISLSIEGQSEEVVLQKTQVIVQ